MKRFFLLVVACCVLAPGVMAVDTHVFYRAGLMPDMPRHYSGSTKNDDKTQPIQVVLRVASGSTRDAFDGHEKKTALFNAHGAFDVLRLGNNLQDLTGKQETSSLWNPTTGTWRANELTALSASDGKIVYSGRFSTTDVSLIGQVPLFSGLYAQACVPFSKLTVDSIAFKNQGASTVKNINIDTFMKTTLPLVLAENGINPIGDIRRDLSIGDPVLSVGWEGYSARLAPLVTEVAGYMQLGVSLPVADSAKQSVVFDLPHGYNGHLGCIGRGAIEANFFDWVTLGVQAGSSIFFPDRRDVPLKTDKAQNGWIVLEKVRVKEDFGSQWDVGGYLCITKIVKGLRALVGYTFTRQEATTYVVKDGNYLKDYRAAQLALPDGAVFVSQDDYANSDTRLQGWESQVLRTALQVNTAEMFGSSLGALAGIEYNIPILGKYSWATDMTAGSLGCSFVLNF